LQYFFNENEHQFRENVRFNRSTNCFIYFEHSLSDFRDLLLFSFVFFHICSIIFLLLSRQFMKIFAKRDCVKSCANWLIWFVIKSSAIVDDAKSDCLTTKWDISERTSSRDSSVLSYEFIYSHILIFRVKSFNSSIHKWKLFELKINMMILKKILSLFIIEEKNLIFKD
jgi:hypothetical protein